jgi:hypothetical protein
MHALRCGEVTLTVQVWAALSRPPHEDAERWVQVHVSDDRSVEQAENEARLIACQVVSTDPDVVMPVRAEVVDITDI